MCASAVVHLARLQVPRGKRAKTKMHLRYLSCQGHLDRVLMAAPTRRFPDPCQDQKSASVRLATRVETYFLTSSAFTTTIPPHPQANKSKKRTHKNRCFFFHSSPQRSTWSTQNSSGMQSCTSGGFSGATRTPSSVSSTVNPAGLPAKSQILRRERSWKSWNEIKWTPVVWHSWLENHPSPFLPTPIRNKTSSRFKKMRNSLDLMAWNYHGLKVDQNPSWENMRDPGPLVVVSHEMDSNLRRFVTARFGALFDFI